MLTKVDVESLRLVTRLISILRWLSIHPSTRLKLKIFVGVAVQHPKPVVGIGARPASGRGPDGHEVSVGHVMVAAIRLDGGDGCGWQKVGVLSSVGVIAQIGGLVQGGEEFAGEAQFLAQGDFLLIRRFGDGTHKIRI